MNTLNDEREWYPSETPPPVESDPMPVWIYQPGGSIIQGFHVQNLNYGLGEEGSHWFDEKLIEMVEDEAAYWMLRREGEARPEPPR